MSVAGPGNAQGPRPFATLSIGLVFVACLLAWRSADERLMLWVFAPLAEELIFRWGVQDGLESLGSSSAVAMLGSAALFAVMHGLSRSWALAVGVLLPALAFAALYRRTRRLAPCVALHAAANAVWLAGVSTGLIEGVPA